MMMMMMMMILLLSCVHLLFSIMFSTLISSHDEYRYRRHQRPNPSYTVGMRSGVRPNKSATAFSPYLDFEGWKCMVWHFYFQVWSIMQAIFSTGAGPIFSCWPLPGGENFGLWSLIRVSWAAIPQKSYEELITLSQTPQLEGFAAIAPRTPSHALGPAF